MRTRAASVAAALLLAACDGPPPLDPVANLAAEEDEARARAVAAEMDWIETMRADLLRNAERAALEAELAAEIEANLLLDPPIAAPPAIETPLPEPTPEPPSAEALRNADAAVRAAMERRRAER